MRAEAPTSPVAVGARLAGKYRVDSILGAGGMGVVVAATHEELEQRVAIKFLLGTGAANADLVRRFLREGKAASRLKSEHVAKVIDFGRLEDGAPYIVMEYLEGDDLRAVLRREGPFPVEVAARYVLQAIEAVAEAHAAKIVHRDLKPGNLFLTRRVNGDPLVKVLDFGISKALDGTHTALTLSENLLGSPRYMSPEQMRSSKSVDTRADIWSLGVILYELLTGRYPFDSETVLGLVFQVNMQAPVAPRQRRPDLPADLEAVILRCLSKAVDDRYPDVAALAEALEPYAGHAARGASASIAAVIKEPPRRSFASLSSEDAAPLNVTRAFGPKPARHESPTGSPPSGSRPDTIPPSAPVALAPAVDPPGSVRAIGAASAWGTTHSDKVVVNRKALPWRAALTVFVAVLAGALGVQFAFGALGTRSGTVTASASSLMGTTSTLALPPATTSLLSDQTAPPLPSATTSLLPDQRAAPVPPAASSAAVMAGHLPHDQASRGLRRSVRLPSSATADRPSSAPGATTPTPAQVAPSATAAPSSPPPFVPY